MERKAALSLLAISESSQNRLGGVSPHSPKSIINEGNQDSERLRTLADVVVADSQQPLQGWRQQWQRLQGSEPTLVMFKVLTNGEKDGRLSRIIIPAKFKEEVFDNLDAKERASAKEWRGLGVSLMDQEGIHWEECELGTFGSLMLHSIKGWKEIVRNHSFDRDGDVNVRLMMFRYDSDSDEKLCFVIQDNN